MKKSFTRFGKRTWIIVGGIVVILTILFFAFRGNGNNSASAFQTEKVERGTLTVTVGATGTVHAQRKRGA